MRLFARLFAVLAVLATGAGAERLVIIDQDSSGPAGSNQMAMIALLQAPDVHVLGITIVTGDAWQAEEVAHTLRMLELIHRTDVPVVAGATYPLLRTRAETLADRARFGGFSWYGAWGDVAEHTSDQPFHAPDVIPAMKEGLPTTHALSGQDAAHFLITQVHAHPHQVTIFAAGPLTNVALALSLDSQLAELTQGIVIMGGSLAPQSTDPENNTHPRHEFNFWFDPEAAHIVLRAAWPRIDLTPLDVSVRTLFTPELRQRIAASPQPAAQFVAQYNDEALPMWDQVAACAWLDPKIITRAQTLFVDVDLSHGPNYGDMLTWDAAHKPQRDDLRPVHLQQDLDTVHFYDLFVRLTQLPPHAH